MDIGSKIRDLRIQNNLTQDELAQKLSVTSQAVSRWECGVSLPDITMVPLIARTLFASADELLGCGMPKAMKFASCQNLDCSGERLNQSQIDGMLENNDLISDGTPKKVLIVDDSDFMRMMLNDILTKAGHTVVQADNGKLALKVLQDEKVDICILDIMMPEMNGIDALRQILLNIPDMPVVMLSALCNEHIVKEALANGAAELLYIVMKVKKFFLTENFYCIMLTKIIKTVKKRKTRCLKYILMKKRTKLLRSLSGKPMFSCRRRVLRKPRLMNWSKEQVFPRELFICFTRQRRCSCLMFLRIFINR